MSIEQARQIFKDYAESNSDIDSGNLYWALGVALQAIQEEALRNVQRLGQEIEAEKREAYQEPVGFFKKEVDLWHQYYEDYPNPNELTPLYTASPQRQWVGMTVDEFYDLDDVGRKMILQYGQAVEEKLKRKNGYE